MYFAVLNFGACPLTFSFSPRCKHQPRGQALCPCLHDGALRFSNFTCDRRVKFIARRQPGALPSRLNHRGVHVTQRCSLQREIDMVVDGSPALRDVPVVVGLGDPVMDILANVSANWLATVTPEPGGCLPVPPDAMEKLLADASKQSHLVRIPGGSAANVMKGIANIAGSNGARCRFVGMIGTDATGAEYRRKLTSQGVEPLLLESHSGAPSACAVCLVTPDGQRTMRTCLGASLELRSAAQLDGGWVDGVRLLHAEGYCLYRPQLAREMMTSARQAGALVTLDLASFELVRNCKEALMALLQDGLVDLVFANEEEAIMLCQVLGLLTQQQQEHPVGKDATAVGGCPPEPDPAACVAAAQRFLLSPDGGRARVAVTSLGSRGCVARGADGQEAAAPACRVTVVDTVGAGDFFTSGFLAAVLRGASLQQCCAAGCAAGAEAVQAVGAELSPAAFSRLRMALDGVIATKAAATGPSAMAVAAAAASAIEAALAGVEADELTSRSLAPAAQTLPPTVPPAVSVSTAM